MKAGIPDDILRNELNEESILLNLNGENYFGLDNIGTRMLNALVSSDSIHGAHQKILAEYDVDPERLQKDMSLFVESLHSHGLITVTDP